MNDKEDITNFDRLFRDKLGGHEIRAGEHNWEAISRTVGRKRVLIRRLSLCSGVAAAIILAVFIVADNGKSGIDESLLASSSDTTVVVEPVKIIEREEPPLENLLATDTPVSDKERAVTDNSQRAINRNPSENQLLSIADEENKERSGNKSGEDSEQEISEDSKQEISKESEQDREEVVNSRTDEQKSDGTSGRDDNRVRTIYDDEFSRSDFSEQSGKRRRQGKGWDVGLSLLSSAKATNKDIYALDMAAPGIYLTSSPANISNIDGLKNAAASHSSNTKYAPPISAGISIRRYLTGSIAIESGITYSYLSTERQYQGNENEALKLHYIGIPLSLTYDLLNINEKFRLYLSTGGVVEKGVSSKYFALNSTSNVKGSRTIPGVQWSVNAAAGASYNIFRMCALYVEPKISLYFDNDQPVSIRTENGYIFGINAGIRFTL